MLDPFISHHHKLCIPATMNLVFARASNYTVSAREKKKEFAGDFTYLVESAAYLDPNRRL